MDRNLFIGIWALLMIPLATFLGIVGMVVGVVVILFLGLGGKDA